MLIDHYSCCQGAEIARLHEPHKTVTEALGNVKTLCAEASIDVTTGGRFGSA